MHLRLKEVRLSQGKRLKDVQALLGHPRSISVISRYENGLIPITLHELAEFAQAYGVSVHDLIAEDPSAYAGR